MLRLFHVTICISGFGYNPPNEMRKCLSLLGIVDKKMHQKELKQNYAFPWVLNVDNNL